MASMFDLVFLSGVRAGALISIDHNVNLGRSTDCQIEVPDPNASRFHAVVEFDGRTLVAADTNSSNGTFVNEYRITRQELSHGDVIRIGETRMRIQRRRQRSGSQTDSDSSNSLSSVFSLKEPEKDSLDSSMSLSMLDDQLNVKGRSAEVLSVRLQAVQWVSETLSTFGTDENIYPPILDTLFKVFPQAERGFLLVGDQFEKLQPRAMLYRSGKKKKDGIEVSASLCRAALEKKAIIVYSDKSTSDFDQAMSLVALNIHSAMVVPLMVKDEVLGLLVIDTQDSRRPFNNDDMELAATVARQVAFALKNALLLDQVEAEVTQRRNLMRFLPKPLVDQVVSSNMDLELGGSDYRGTVFFADVIGFTRIAEALKPQETITMMNAFFNAMVPVVEAEEGAIDKFMGDSIMAFWGIPFDKGDSNERAIRAGLKMQNTLSGFNSVQVEGRVPLHMGVGASAGLVVAGNIGSEDRKEYTVLGNVVNTSSRIQAVACRHQVLVGDTIVNMVKDKLYGVALPPISLKNKAQEKRIFSIRGIAVESEEILMHLPVKVGGLGCVIIRRLVDDTFVLLHPPELNLDGATAVIEAVEMPALELGGLREVTRLFAQAVDGTLRRSVIDVADRTLGGLLGNDFISCPHAWSVMERAC